MLIEFSCEHLLMYVRATVDTMYHFFFFGIRRTDFEKTYYTRNM